MATAAEMLSRYPHLVRENERLNQWKREALVVLSDWEEVWEAAGRPGRLGSSKAKNVLHEVERLKDLNGRLMEELAKHGWGDFHYGPQDQDPNIVALLEEGKFTKEGT